MFELLKRKSFAALTVTQFLGAFNDNAFKQLVLLLIVAAGAGASSPDWVVEHPWVEYGQALPSALFALPFVLFGATTGSLADRVSKSRVIKLAKVGEIAVMGLALVAFLIRDYSFLMVVVFLMGTQSAIFGPSKYGSIPEMLEGRELSRGNAIVQMTTMISIILGTLLGGLLKDNFSEALWIPACIYIGLALLGTLASTGVQRLEPADPTRRIGLNVFAEIRRHWKVTAGDRTVILSLFASAFFYLVAMTLILAVNQYGEWLGLDGTGIATLLAIISVGIAVGSILAGKISGERIEGGLVPIGLFAMVASLLLVWFDPRSLSLLRFSLLGTGISAGLFTIPIRALIQHRPPPERKGAVLGLSEVMDFSGILTASGVFFLLNNKLGLSPPQMFLVLAAGVLIFMTGSLLYTVEFALRLCLFLLVHSIYRIRVQGRRHVPQGGALLVSNHLSFVDAFLIAAAAPRPVRFMMYRGFFDLPIVGHFARMMGTIPVSSADSRRRKLEALQQAADCAASGELVCIFAEGAISRTGAMLPFARGMERIASKAGVPIVPVALDRVWGSIFSFEGARVFWKRPQRLPYPVDVLFGEPLPNETSRWEVRNRIAELIAQRREERDSRRGSLTYRFLLSAKRYGSRMALFDSTGPKMTYRRLLRASLVMSSYFKDRLGSEENVAVLLPPGAGGVLANVALPLAGKVSVNLNYTLSGEAIAGLARRAGAAQLVTSRRFLDALGMPSPLAEADTIYLEDVREALSTRNKLVGLLQSLLPGFLLARLLDPVQHAHETATIIFSSGSTAEPKGIVLSHGNILSNVQGVCQMVHLESSDRMLGVLPFFHSFGYTVTMWAPLLNGAAAVYHANPLDAKTIGKLSQKHGVTIMLATPTFYLSYLRRCKPEQFEKVRIAVAGAEKLKESLANAWLKKFGQDILEGYGATELSPVVSVNVPDVHLLGSREKGSKRGSIGRPLPGTAVKVVDPETGRVQPPGEEGLLLVRGPGVMQGYLGEPERTAEVMRDGWYVTGDVALIDNDGFLVITDRLSRFAKIAGEMVPHGKVEDALADVVARLAGRESQAPEEEQESDELEVAVTSLPDEQKGEKLVVLHTPLPFEVQRVVDELGQTGLPKLFMPRSANFVEVEHIPKLGSGKTDLREIKAIAREHLEVG